MLVTWVPAADDVARGWLVAAGWATDGAHRTVELDGRVVREPGSPPTCARTLRDRRRAGVAAGAQTDPRRRHQHRHRCRHLRPVVRCARGHLGVQHRPDDGPVVPDLHRGQPVRPRRRGRRRRLGAGRRARSPVPRHPQLALRPFAGSPPRGAWSASAARRTPRHRRVHRHDDQPARPSRRTVGVLVDRSGDLRVLEHRHRAGRARRRGDRGPADVRAGRRRRGCLPGPTVAPAGRARLPDHRSAGRDGGAGADPSAAAGVPVLLAAAVAVVVAWPAPRRGEPGRALAGSG